MTSFNWPAFLASQGVHFVREGANVSEGNINVRCPFCGDADPSEHLGIHLATGKWGCWRNAHHRGTSALRLIEALLACDRPRALLLASAFGSRTAIGEFDQVSVNPFGDSEEEVQAEPRLAMPDDFRLIDTSYSAQPHRSYLLRRGFRLWDVTKVIEKYDLRYTITRPFWTYRVIWPIYLHGRLVGFTGRTIRTDERTRYKSLSHHPDKVKDGFLAPVNIKHTLLNYESVKYSGGKVLFVVEGPLDCIKLDFYGEEYGCRAVSLFSMECTDQQAALLFNLRGGFDRMCLVLDQGESGTALATAGRLDALGIEVLSLPPDVEDPGAMSDVQARAFAKAQL